MIALVVTYSGFNSVVINRAIDKLRERGYVVYTFSSSGKKNDLLKLLAQCDVVVLLKNWMYNTTCQFTALIASEIDKPIVSAETLEPLKHDPAIYINQVNRNTNTKPF